MQSRLRCLWAFLAFAVVTALSTQAQASGGEIPPLARDIGISVLFAGALGVLFARFRIPSIAAFITAGVLVGPLGLRQVTDPENIDTIAQLGFIFLLFMIGVEIDVRAIFRGGRTLVLVGLLQYPLTLVFGLLVTQLLAGLGIGGDLLANGLAPFYIGAVIAGSSTLQVVRLFQQHFELDTQPGRIALILLIFQDIWATVVTLVQPNLTHPEVAPILYSFAGIGILVVVAWLVSRFIVGPAFHWVSKTPELVVLGAFSWCFAIVMLGTSLDNIAGLFGIHAHLSVGSGMAAMIAGAAIASLPFSSEVTTKVSVVKDFFVTLFFVGLGISIPAPQGWDVPLLAVAMAVIAILARQLVFFPLMGLLGIDQRNAMVASVRLAQISEFGLVISFLGVEQGQISPQLGSAIILAFVLTSLATTPLFKYSYPLHSWLSPLLNRLGFREPPPLLEDEVEHYEIALLGLHRDASSFLHELSVRLPEILPKTLVVDFNVALHGKLRGIGVNVQYGDISNEETLLHAGVDRAKIIICSISDDLLRGISTRDLVASVRRMCPEAVIIANAVQMVAVAPLYEAGADYVYMPRLEVAHALHDVLSYALDGRIEDCREALKERFGTLTERQEVLT